MFIPPHCPNPGCTCFHRAPEAKWYSNFGQYPNKTFGIIPRFRCRSCRRTFSSQTFSINYGARRDLDYLYIFNQIDAGAGLRNIGRNLGVAHMTVGNRINRMARNAVLAHEQIIRRLPFWEDLVIDGFESFCRSQYHPDNYNIVVGKDSQFVYRIDYSHLRRKGRMTPRQKVKRALIEMIWKPSPKAVERSFGELCAWVLRAAFRRTLPLVIDTDEKRDYVRALRNHPACREAFFSGRIRHRRTSSKVARNYQNLLFAANYIDRELRKDMAAHARESVQYNRNVNNGMLRMSLYLFEHNYMKPFRVAKPEHLDERHAHWAGLEDRHFAGWVAGLFTERFFWRVEGVEMEGPGRVTLERGWTTPLRRGRERSPGWMIA